MYSRLTLSNSCTPGDPLEPRRTPSKDSKILPTGDQFIKAAAPTFQASGEAWKVHKKTQVSPLKTSWSRPLKTQKKHESIANVWHIQDHLTGASLHLETDLNQGKTWEHKGQELQETIETWFQDFGKKRDTWALWQTLGLVLKFILWSLVNFIDF